MIKCQEKLLKTINSLEYLPHSILLLGDYGSDYTGINEHIANKFDLQLINITDNINNDVIFDILSTFTPTLYYINLFEVGIKEQNIILKLFEEPSKYSYIVINAAQSDFILDTIKSRSYILKFDNYSKEYLESLIYLTFSGSEIKVILDTCTTPGLIDIANHTNIKELYDLCYKTISDMKNTNFQNALNIANKINYKDLYDKYDLILFIKMLKYVILCSNFNYKKDIYSIVLNNTKNINMINNKQQLIEQLIIKMWKYFN